MKAEQVRAVMREFKKALAAAVIILASGSLMMGGQSDRGPRATVPLQPLAAQVRELETTLEFLGPKTLVEYVNAIRDRHWARDWNATDTVPASGEGMAAGNETGRVPYVET